METVLITGASRGIGLELVKQFLKSGYKVIGTHRGQHSEELKSLKSSGNLDIYELEVTDDLSITKLADNLKGTTIDILINNAGILGPESQALESVDAEGWMKTFMVNSIAPLMVSRALLPNLKLSSNPRIITVSSMMGSTESAGSGMYAYRSSKAAVNNVMKVLSNELADYGIVVCPIHPGWVKTDMGGPNAKITTTGSSRGIIKLAEGLTIKDSGKFYTWDSQQLDW